MLAVAFQPADTDSLLITDKAAPAQPSVQLYSMRSHSYVHALTFKTQILGLKCSTRLLVVALDSQIHAYDAITLQHTFSAVTYSVSAALSTWASDVTTAGLPAPMALGSAWLAYASNQASVLLVVLTANTLVTHESTHYSTASAHMTGL